MKAVPPSRYLLFLLLVVGGCAVDLATKTWTFAWLGMPGESPTWWVVPGVLGVQTSLNEGALFGLGQGMVPMFAVFSIIAALGILWWLFVSGAAESLLLTIALGCIAGGIFGNLYDRLGMPGLRWNYPNSLHEVGGPVHAVRDWILVMIGSWPWPTFNIADSLLVCGAALLAWHAFEKKPEQAGGAGDKAVGKR